MDQEHEVRYLIDLLKQSSALKGKQVIHTSIIDNLVYYVPRLQNAKIVFSLISALFETTLWYEEDVDPVKVLDMAQSIFYWKLEISEPTLTVDEFFQLWDRVITNNTGWSVYKLALLSGICTSADKFEELQRKYYIAETPREIRNMYHYWKYDVFMNSWSQFLLKSADDSRKDVPRIETLCLLYCPISKLEDLSISASKGINFPLYFVIIALSNLAIIYALDHPPEDEFLARNINQVARTLQLLLPKCDNQKELSMIMDELCVACFNISSKETSSEMPNKDYSGVKYYSNTLLTFTLIFKGILNSKTNKTRSIYYQILTCMYYLNFIALDFGTIGFESYEYTYNASIFGVTAPGDDLVVYNSLITTFNNNIWHTLKYPNKINDSKLLFLLDFLKNSIETTTLNFGNTFTAADFVNDTIVPLKLQYLNSKDEVIRDTMHSVMLATFSNNISGHHLLEWQRKNFLSYLSASTEQYTRHNLLKEDQIIHIYQTLGYRMATLDTIAINDDESCTLSRETLNFTYLQVKNGRNKQMRIVMLKCLIYLIPYTNHNYILMWLNNIMQLFDEELGPTNPEDHRVLFDTLWDVIPNVKTTDIALKWWYSTIVPRIRKSKL
ncbi:Pex8p [Nakaseomyces bracarensis]|uniref:Pex8p n=1 Tax=Nakaseomyces bracarensis TaxID=273131 RepID=UPI003871DA93